MGPAANLLYVHEFPPTPRMAVVSAGEGRNDIVQKLDTCSYGAKREVDTETTNDNINNNYAKLRGRTIVPRKPMKIMYNKSILCKKVEDLTTPDEFIPNFQSHVTIKTIPNAQNTSTEPVTKKTATPSTLTEYDNFDEVLQRIALDPKPSTSGGGTAPLIRPVPPNVPAQPIVPVIPSGSDTPGGSDAPSDSDTPKPLQQEVLDKLFDKYGENVLTPLTTRLRYVFENIKDREIYKYCKLVVDFAARRLPQEYKKVTAYTYTNLLKYDNLANEDIEIYNSYPGDDEVAANENGASFVFYTFLDLIEPHLSGEDRENFEPLIIHPIDFYLKSKEYLDYMEKVYESAWKTGDPTFRDLLNLNTDERSPQLNYTWEDYRQENPLGYSFE